MLKSKSKTRFFINALLVNLMIGIGIFYFGCDGQNNPPTVNQGSVVYDRVIGSGKIRCGYLVAPPDLIKDPNTGKISGISAETVEQAGRRLGLQIEWVEEVNFGNMIEGLNSDRYDLLCSTVWQNSTRGKIAEFTVPLYFSGVGAYVRKGDSRFTNNISSINDPKIKIATTDGEMAEIIAKEDFPQATLNSLPQLSDTSQLLLEVASGKADITFITPTVAALYTKNNPDKVINITQEKPIRIFPHTLMMKGGEFRFKSMLDTVIDEMFNNGLLDTLIDRYAVAPDAYYRRAFPYRPSAVENQKTSQNKAQSATAK